MVNKELTIRNKHGQKLNVLVSSALLSIDDHKLMLSVLRDVTELKKVEKDLKTSNSRLRASEEKFTTFIGHSPDGIMMTDEQGIIQEWNHSMERLTGIASTEAWGSALNDVLTKVYRYTIGDVPDLALKKERYSAFFHSGDAGLIRLKESREVFIPESGRLFIEIYTFPIMTERGGRIGQIVRDITEQKEFERNVLLYRDIFMNNEDGIAILDLHGRYTEFNPAHKEILGYSHGDLIGKTPGVFLGDKLFGEIFKVYDYQKAFEGELNASRKNGKKIFIDFILFPVLSGDNPVQIIAIIRDISERKKSERQLIEARRAAEEADSLKTAFLSNMSHEIRTPMNSIIGFSGLLERPGLSEEKRNKYIGYINKNGDNLLHLIDDIIDITKIESNQVKIQKSACNLHEMAEELLNTMSRVLQQEGKTSLELIPKFPECRIMDNHG